MHRPFPLPGARPQYAPDRPFRARHVRLELAIDLPSRTIRGTCTLTVAPVARTARTLVLDAVEMEVSGVRALPASGKGGQPLPLHFVYDGARLQIDLGLDRKPGDAIDVAIDYSAAPRRGLYFHGPDAGYPDRPLQVWTQGQDEDSRHWFPCLDTPHDKATSEVIVTVPRPWFALSNGRLLERREGAGDTATYHWRLDVPHAPYLMTLVAGEYDTLTDRAGDVEVSYHVAKGRLDDARRSFARTPQMMALFAERTGVPYPYPKYAQITVSEFIFGGMENTSATTLTDLTLHDERAHLDFSSEPLVSHELAHQWFGDLVTCRDWSHGWLNEGFATFLENVWMEHAQGAEEAGYDRLDVAERYFKEDRDRYRRPIVTNVFHEPLDLFDRHLYEKGSWVLHMLRDLLGDEPFWAAIRHYVAAHRMATVETRDLARAVDEATGRNVDWFFDQWVLKAGHPELRVEHGWDEERKLARVRVEQRQKVEGETPLFRLPARVRFRVGASDLTFDLEITEAEQTFFFPLPAAPEQAIFDPGAHLLARVQTDKPRALWLAQLAGASDVLDRVAAARALARRAEPEVVAALGRALSDDPFWGVRAEAATALGAIRGEAARAWLVGAIATPHPKARRAVVRALGEWRGDATAADALRAVVERGDASYFVEAEATLALARTRDARAFDLLRATLDRPSFQDVIRQRCLDGLAELRDPRGFPLVVDATRYGRPSPSRRAACAAVAKLAAAASAEREARETLEQLLDDPDFRVRMAAVAALADLGDARAVPALERAVDRDLDPRLKRAAREAARDLQEQRKQQDALRELRDRLAASESEARGLRERVERLEARLGLTEPTESPAVVPGEPLKFPRVSSGRRVPPAAAARPVAKRRTTRPKKR